MRRGMNIFANINMANGIAMRIAGKAIAYVVLLIIGIGLGSCDVHEFPEIPQKAAVTIKLNYHTDMEKWEHTYNSNTGMSNTNQGTRGMQTYGVMRYILRAYPLNSNGRAANEHTFEKVFYKDITTGYNTNVTVELNTGEYTLMVWSDLLEHGQEQTPFYNATSFAEVILEQHRGNTDYRDAFRGSNSLILTTDIQEHEPEVVTIEMERPLGKYEFISTDLQEFINKEIQEAISRGETKGPTDDELNTPTKGLDLEDYKIVIYYPGFMPNAFSIFSDKPVDSGTGMKYESAITMINENEASLGFDYVFVNGRNASVSVQVGIYNKQGGEISLSNPIDVPLLRGHHTIIRGSFLMQKTNGGITINPDFDGDHNVTID